MKKTRLCITRIAIIIAFLMISGVSWPGIFANSLPANSLPGQEETQAIYPVNARVKPVIDGNLDEETWKTPPIENDFTSFSPYYGDILPQKTHAWLAYDNENLYFAFLCEVTGPQKLKTSITKRDNMFNDDWVGLSIDTAGNRQTSYQLYVNPNGIQGDALKSVDGGEDTAPDFIWECAAKVTAQGYQVEISFPLKSIRFKSGKEVKMGVLFWRKIAGLGIVGAWPAIKPGQSVFNSHKTVVYEKLRKSLNFELLPSITYSNNRERIAPSQWGKKDIRTDIGVGLKVGITSAVTAEITVNPDFSQVESDAFQVDVNQRYPLFYKEKRPFFMEGSGIFSFFTIPDGNLSRAVHTRRIVDPLWGTKLTGTAGKIDFGFLAAGDDWPGKVWNGENNPPQDKKAFFGIARGKYSLGKDNYLGLLYSGREFAGDYNRVLGIDAGWRVFNNHKFNLSFLRSMSGNKSNNDKNANDSDYNMMYSFYTRPVVIEAAFEHVGRFFRMDSAFMKRNGVNEVGAIFRYNFYPDPKKFSWLKRISPALLGQSLHDLNTGMDDSFLRLSLDFNTIKQGYITFQYYGRKESWQGQTFDLDQLYVYATLQITRWLQMTGAFTYGEKIYYVAEPSTKGQGLDGLISLAFQPNKNLNQQFQFQHSQLSKKNEKLYNVNLYYSRTTYQFNKYFFLRAVIQYNSFQKRMLTDFLASFTLIPGTVVHVGYGGIYENRDWQGGNWIYRQGELLNMKRSLFLKASYLWRF